MHELSIATESIKSAKNVQTGGIKIIYDGECIFCRQFVRRYRLRKAVSSVELINARTQSPLMTEITKSGPDINQGMIVIYREKIFHGAAALHLLALLTSRSDTFNRINALVFKSRALTLLLYPALKAYRNIFLWLSNKPQIHYPGGEKPQ